MTNEASLAVETLRRIDFQSAPSLACDLCWVTSVARKPTNEKKHQLRAEIYNGREELAERVRTFWNDSATDSCFTEMQALAHYAGAITETSPAALWAAMEEAVHTVPLDLGLESEYPEDRERFLHRLAQLQASPDLMARYLALLQEVWEPLNDAWQAALPVMRESGDRMLERLQSGKPFQDLVTVTCEVYQARLPTITSQVEAGRTLMVVPCFFFGTSMYLELTGMTLIGTGVDEHGSMARARTESVARRLKTVADPTRLALLHFLSVQPSSVSDLAVSFGLAQPTVSMHVKLLRETGLVKAERQGGRLQLSADPDAVDSLLSDLRGVVVQPVSV
jgi:DNA-binding transcriptional ArsR family regulator